MIRKICGMKIKKALEHSWWSYVYCLIKSILCAINSKSIATNAIKADLDLNLPLS